MPEHPPLVLASGSTHRRALLERLLLDFTVDPPDIDESRRPEEQPDDYVSRLAAEKAATVAARQPGAVVIGSDQACVRDGHVLGKPGSLEAAREQLLAASGKTLTFMTGLCVHDTRSDQTATTMELVRVRFRTLDPGTVERYLSQEPALDAAGSFHSEGLGISLFEAQESEDPTALVGLPLIALCRMLRPLGYRIP